MIKLCLYLLICEQATSYSLDLFGKNHTIINGGISNNILEKFLFSLKILYLEKHEPRHITIVGGGNEDIQQVEPLFKNYPQILCKDTEKCGYSKRFSRGSFVIIFHDKLIDNVFEKNIELLSRCRECRIIFISNKNIQPNDIKLTFNLATKQNMQYVVFAHINENQIKIYSRIVAPNCSMEIRLLIVWRPGISRLDKIHPWAFKLLENLNGCPITVGSLTFRPKMLIKEKNNDSLVIIGGREGKMLLAIAEKLNFTVDLRYPSVVDRMKYSRKMSIINDVINGIVEIGIGRLLPTNDIHQLVSFSVGYDEECVTWGVPLIKNWSDAILSEEFSPEIWVLVSLAFFSTCVIEYADKKLNSVKKRNETNLGLIETVLNVVAIDLGNPIVYRHSSAVSRIMLIFQLYYAMVITTAYKTSLASILATDEGTPMFLDVEGILKANIKLGGSLYDYNILKDQVNDSELISKLLDRFVINNNDTESMHQLKHDHDFAFLARLSSLNYQMLKMIKKQESIAFYNLQGCVLAYHTVVVFQKTSLLRLPIDDIIWRLMEAGLLEHWDREQMYSEQILKSGYSRTHFQKQNAYRFSILFILYSAGITLSVVSLLIELLVASIGYKKNTL